MGYRLTVHIDDAPTIKNEKTEQLVLEFIKERIRNVLKLKNIKTDTTINANAKF